MAVKKLIKSFLIFLLVNFLTLYLGVSLYGEGGTSSWYINLNRAPWEPPGWVFGAAWSSIMIFFAMYMSYCWYKVKMKILPIYLMQLILNISWNPVFFRYHYILLGLLIIILLATVVTFMLYKYWVEIKLRSILILPYLIWLVIAISLNGYTFIYN